MLTRDPDEVSAAIKAGSNAMRTLIAEAFAECATDRPAMALALGRDFWSLSGGQKGREDIAVQLLEAAYRALGRDALAEIAAIHHQYRHLGDVDDFRSLLDEPQE